MSTRRTVYFVMGTLVLSCALLMGVSDGMRTSVVKVLVPESTAQTAQPEVQEPPVQVEIKEPEVAAAGFTRDEMAQYIMSKNSRVFPKLAGIIADAVMAAAEEFDTPPGYIFALMSVESTFRYDAVSSAECIGLMQINPKHWAGDKDGSDALIKAGVVDSIRDLYDPEINIRAGAYILSHYINKGKERGVQNPVEYGLTRYFGGTQNSHFDKMCKELGKFYVFVQRRVSVS